MSVLALRLEAPLQAWGDDARWSVRGTRPEPTLSGVLGLIAAALGWRLDEDGDRRITALAERVRLGVRADREGAPLRDYQTIGGTRTARPTAWSGLLTAEGKTKRTATSGELHTEVSERSYLADACFLAQLEADEATLGGIEAALREPVWPPFLGRKACVPAAPICPALPGAAAIVDEPLLDALAGFPWLGRNHDAPPEGLRAVVDATACSEGRRSVRHDVPRSLLHRRFAERYVRELILAGPVTDAEV